MVLARWTDTDDELLRRYYPAGGSRAVRAGLPGRSAGAINQRAMQLGLKAPSARVHDRDGSLDAAIRDGWAESAGRIGKGAVAELATRLGLPRYYVSRRATIMGLTLPRKRRDWTEAELALFATLPLYDLKRSAAIMREHGFDRSPSAIEVRAAQMRISRRATHETFSATIAGSLLGRDPKTVSDMCRSGEIVATHVDDKRTAQQGGPRWAIEPEQLRRYIVEHPEAVELRRVDKVPFIALLASGERLRPTAGLVPSPVAERRQSPVVGWTPDKLAKARRLFGKVMVEIAWALNVPPDELLRYGLNGVIPPMKSGAGFALPALPAPAPPPDPIPDPEQSIWAGSDDAERDKVRIERAERLASERATKAKARKLASTEAAARRTREHSERQARVAEERAAVRRQRSEALAVEKAQRVEARAALAREKAAAEAAIKARKTQLREANAARRKAIAARPAPKAAPSEPVPAASAVPATEDEHIERSGSTGGRGAQFYRLKAADGRYLNLDGTDLIRDRDHGYRALLPQARTMRRKLRGTFDLTLVEIPKWQPRTA